ncbi:MAG: FAD-binding oxidoreductase [Prolixibacteraceae bacterium]|nr:FAD-binding oxidoreductase [Prolixibacteraceae bacterium]
MKISLQSGLIRGKVNSLLARYGRKIGPDPASIDTAMIVGIAATMQVVCAAGLSKTLTKRWPPCVLFC